MRLLLDTHLLLWAAGPSPRLSAEARRAINDLDNELVFSVASIWEVAIKFSSRRDAFNTEPRAVRRLLLDNQYRELPVTGEHAVAVADLPALHRDPFDRILVAQSIVERITLLTSDPLVAQYSALIRRV